MHKEDALELANDLLTAFIEHQDIPPGGTSDTAREHGQKTGQFLAALHRALYDYFLEVEDSE